MREIIEEIIRTVRRSPTNYDYEINIEYLTNQALALIEAEFTKRKEEWKKELVGKLPKEWFDNPYVEISNYERYKGEGFNNCLSQLKQIIEKLE